MITDLVISGGGIKELYILGGLLYLEDMNMLQSVKYYYGTSAGSICSLLLILGYDVKKIIKIFNNLVKPSLFDLNLDMEQLLEKYCVYDTTKFIRLIKSLIGCKLDNENPKRFANITMLELFNLKQKTLTITVTNLNTGKAEYITHLTHPTIPVYKAIQMSCSIPGLFEPCIWNENMYVDGGICDNYPFTMVPESRYNTAIGVGIKEQVSYVNMEYGDIVSYFGRIVNIGISVGIISNHPNALYVTADQKYNKDIVDADLTNEEKETIVLSGYNEVKEQMLKRKPKRRNSFS